MGFYILWIAGREKLIDISKWRQEWIYCGRSKLYTPLRQPEVTKKGLFSFFFWSLHDEIWKSSISRELYIKLN